MMAALWIHEIMVSLKHLNENVGFGKGLKWLGLNEAIFLVF